MFKRLQDQQLFMYVDNRKSEVLGKKAADAIKQFKQRFENMNPGDLVGCKGKADNSGDNIDITCKLISPSGPREVKFRISGGVHEKMEFSVKNKSGKSFLGPANFV